MQESDITSKLHIEAALDALEALEPDLYDDECNELHAFCNLHRNSRGRDALHRVAAFMFDVVRDLDDFGRAFHVRDCRVAAWRLNELALNIQSGRWNERAGERGWERYW